MVRETMGARVGNCQGQAGGMEKHGPLNAAAGAYRLPWLSAE